MKKKLIFLSLLLLLSFGAHAEEAVKVRAYVYYSPTCAKCIAINQYLKELDKKYPLDFKFFNIDDPKYYEEMILFEKKYNVVKKDIPEIFIGDSVFAGKDEIKEYLEPKIKELLAKGGCEWPTCDEIKPGILIAERFKAINVLAIISAGLIDGLNPCAFATIVFFISFLTFIGRNRRDILITGTLFTLAVFVTYLFLGLGAFSFLRSLEFFNRISKAVYIIVGLIAIVFGVLSLYDYYQFKKKQTQDIILQLPTRIKNLIHAVIRASHKTYNLAIAALITGFAVSVLESICTGQVYLPTIIFVLKTKELQGRAFSYLFLYNIMFIIPLVIVFALAFFGATSDRLGKFMQKHLGTMKILAALLFFGLGILLLLQ